MQGRAAAASDAPMAAAARLKITETFYSLQGEADAVRLAHVFHPPDGLPACAASIATPPMHFTAVNGVTSPRSWTKPLTSGARHVCVTGGEPLAQKSCIDAAYRTM